MQFRRRRSQSIFVWMASRRDRNSQIDVRDLNQLDLSQNFNFQTSRTGFDRVAWCALIPVVRQYKSFESITAVRTNRNTSINGKLIDRTANDSMIPLNWEINELWLFRKWICDIATKWSRASYAASAKWIERNGTFSASLARLFETCTLAIFRQAKVKRMHTISLPILSIQLFITLSVCGCTRTWISVAFDAKKADEICENHNEPEMGTHNQPISVLDSSFNVFIWLFSSASR